MTCKECLHCEACTDMIESLGYTVGGDGFNAEKRCKCFTARSEWIHLPCSIDKVFFKPISRRNTIAKCTLSSLTQNADKSWKIRLTSGIFRSAFEITTNDIGKTVFLTREEAEKALKGETE